MQFEQELWLSKCHTATLRHKTGITNLNSAHRLDESVEYCPALCLEIDLCCKDHEHYLCPLNRSLNVLKWNNWAWKKDSWGQPNWSLINPSTGFSDGCKSYDLWLDWGVRSGFPPIFTKTPTSLWEKCWLSNQFGQSVSKSWSSSTCCFFSPLCSHTCSSYHVSV